jgi:hypothetical protein
MRLPVPAALDAATTRLDERIVEGRHVSAAARRAIEGLEQALAANTLSGGCLTSSQRSSRSSARLPGSVV